MRVLLVLILSIFYILTVRWYYVCELKQLCSDTTISEHTATSSELQLTSNSIIFPNSYAPFVFETDSTHTQLSDANSQFLDKMALFLKTHPNKVLNIGSFYQLNGTDAKAENIATERAKFIQQVLTKRGIDNERMQITTAAKETLKHTFQFQFIEN